MGRPGTSGGRRGARDRIDTTSFGAGGGGGGPAASAPVPAAPAAAVPVPEVPTAAVPAAASRPAARSGAFEAPHLGLSRNMMTTLESRVSALGLEVAMRRVEAHLRESGQPPLTVAQKAYMKSIESQRTDFVIYTNDRMRAKAVRAAEKAVREAGGS